MGNEGNDAVNAKFCRLLDDDVHLARFGKGLGEGDGQVFRLSGPDIFHDDAKGLVPCVIDDAFALPAFTVENQNGVARFKAKYGLQVSPIAFRQVVAATELQVPGQIDAGSRH